MQRIPLQVDTSVLSSLWVERRWLDLGLCSNPVCFPFSDAPKQKLWDRDTEISNCLITSSSLSEDVDSSSSSPKLLTRSKQEPWVFYGAHRKTETGNPEKQWPINLDQSRPKVGRKNLKHFWSTSFESKGMKQEKKAQKGNWNYRARAQRKHLPHATPHPQHPVTNIMSPLVKLGSLVSRDAADMCSWLGIGPAIWTHMYLKCISSQWWCKYALCLISAIKTQSEDPLQERDISYWGLPKAS